MQEPGLEQLQYPVGKFVKPAVINQPVISGWIDEIAGTYEKLAALTKGLTAEQLATPYRPGGWQVQQLVHHFVDFNVNGYIRVKLALTENTPTIKPYLENKWAELPDGNNSDIQPSLIIINGLMLRWTKLLRALNDSDMQKKIYHPEAEAEFTVAELTGNYAWHNRHHLAHIENLKMKMGWQVLPGANGAKR